MRTPAFALERDEVREHLPSRRGPQAPVDGGVDACDDLGDGRAAGFECCDDCAFAGFAVGDVLVELGADVADSGPWPP